MKFGILRLYCGKSGAVGFYNMQELGLAREYEKKGHSVDIFVLAPEQKEITVANVSEHICIVTLPCRHIQNHGFFNMSALLERKIEVLQVNGDNQLFTPSVIKFCRKHDIHVYCYIGSIESDSQNKVKKDGNGSFT